MAATMSMAWMILFAMVAEAGGHHRVTPAPDHARPAIAPASRLLGPNPSRSLSAARKCWRRAGSGYRWLADLEEFDTEEVDETWMVHLDLVATVPGACPGPRWSGSASGPLAFEGSSLPPPSSYFPLRC
jgi:hypothetical protein